MPDAGSAEIVLSACMSPDFGFAQLLLLATILFLVSRAIPYLAIGALVLILVPRMFPDDPAAQVIGGLVSNLLVPLILLWMLSTAIKMILGFKTRRHGCRRDQD